jgi:hypothetical protein
MNLRGVVFACLVFGVVAAAFHAEPGARLRSEDECAEPLSGYAVYRSYGWNLHQLESRQ